MDLRNKVALITGAARRVGRSIALGLAERGMHILVHYNRSEEQALRTVEEIREMGVEAELAQGNLGNPIDIEQVFVTLEARFGRVDLLVNSASSFAMGDILELTIEDWNYVMAINLRAPFLCAQRAAHLMLARGTGGVIVNIADLAGEVPWTRFPHHSVSKAGLLMLTRVLAKSLGPVIRASAVVPGPVLKPGDMPDDRWEEMGEHLPLRQTGTPENVAHAVAALAENDFVTGAVLHVDGGEGLLGSIDI